MALSMQQLAGRLAKDSFAYGGLGLLQKAIGFFLLPVYTRLLVPEDYGVLEVGNTAIFFLQIFVLLQIPSAMMRWYLMTAKTEEEKRTILGTSARLVLGSGVIVCALMAAAHRQATVLIFGEAKYESFLWVLIGNTFLVGMFQLRTSFYRTLGQARAYAVQNLVYFVLSLGFQILFVVYFRMKAFGAMVGALCSLSAMALWCLPWFLRQAACPFSWTRAREMLKFCLPMLPGAVALWVLNSSNRYFIREYAGMGEVGLFGIAAKLAMVFTLVVDAFILAWGPVRYELADQPDGKRLLARMATYYCAAATAFAIVLAVFSRDAVHAMATARFYAAASLVAPLVFGSLLYSLHNIFGTGLAITGISYFHPIIYGATCLLNVGLNLIWVPRSGAMGAAMAFLVSQAVALVGFFFASQRFYQVRFEYARLAKLAIAAGLSMAATSLFNPTSPYGGLAVRLLGAMVFPLALLASMFFKPGEWRMLRDTVRKVQSQAYARMG